MEKEKVFLILDSNAIIHRAFHALPNLSSKKGEPAGALYGFILFFLKAIKDYSPEYIAAAFDLHAPTFRHKEYAHYKATRKKAPDELYSQIPKVKEFLKAAGVPVFEKEGYEADDIIGTISSKTPSFAEAIIMTGDFDALQLVNKNVKVFALKRGIKEGVLFDEEKVKEKYSGLSPEELVDFKALRGDPSDNIPGVLGIGEKRAIELIKEFKNIENLHKSKKLAGKMEQAFLSKRLSEIKKDVPISFEIEDCRFADKKEGIAEFLESQGFKSLLERVNKKRNITLWE